MAKEPDVSVRVRAINTNLDERHSGLGDVEVRVVHEGGKKYKVLWIPTGGGGGYVTEFKKKGKYELYTAENFIQAVIYQATKIKLGESASIVDVTSYSLWGDDRYYEIIQNPFEQNPPLYRSFGNDPYYLNNQTKVSIFWFIGDKQSISRLEFGKTYALTEPISNSSGETRATFGGTEGVWSGGALWSLPNGREKLQNTRAINQDAGESIFSEGNTYDDKAAWGQIYGLYIESNNTYEDPLNIIEYKKYDIKKYVLIEHKESGDKFTLEENMTDFVGPFTGEIENQYGFKIGGEVRDVEILESILTIWKKKVADYDALDVCYKKYGGKVDEDLPKHFSCNEVEYRSPVDIKAEEPEPDQTEESVQTQGTPKIKLSVVLPEDFELKVKEDLDEVKVYIGDPPSSGFVFQDDFDNLEELDPEYLESGFSGADEDLIMKEPDEEFKQAIEEAGEEAENNPVSGGDGLPNSWFDYSSNKFKQADVNKTYTFEYKSLIDSSKMTNPKMTKASLIAVKLKVEGGLADNPNDSAAKEGFCPTPKGGKKYHTNKGITYVVWKTVFGSGNDQRFLKMSYNDWVKIFDSKYWNKHGKSSKYDSVNALLVSYAWGGSKDPTIRGAKKILGITSTGLGSSLDIVSEKEAVAALISARAQFFLKISQPGNKNNVFRKGWVNATNAFVKTMYG